MASRGIPVPRCSEFNSTYNKGCRCSFCREEHRKRRNAQRLRVIERERGIPALTDRVDPTTTVQLIRTAYRNGASDEELARLTGLASSTIYKLRVIPLDYVIRSTEIAVIKALRDNEDARAFTDGTLVPTKWTAAMVHGLMAQGWPAAKQAQIIEENLGVPGRLVFAAIRGLHPMMKYSNEQAMRWLVSQIGEKQGPSTRSMKFAKRNGYFPCRYYNRHGNLVQSALPKDLRHRNEGV